MTNEAEARQRYHDFQKEMRSGRSELARTFEKPESEEEARQRYRDFQDKASFNPGQEALNEAAGLPDVKHAAPAEAEPEPDAQDSYKRFHAEARPMRSDLSHYGHGEPDKRTMNKAEAEMKEALADSLSEVVGNAFNRWIQDFKKDAEQRPKDIEIPDFSGEIDE